MGFNPLKKIGKWAKKQYGGGLSMSGLKSSVKGTVKNPVFQAGAALATGGLAGMAIPGIAKVAGLAKKIPGVGKAIEIGGRVGDFGKKVGSVLPDNMNSINDIPGIAKMAGKVGSMSPDAMLGAAGTIDAAMQRRKATELENQGLNRIRGSYDARSGLRSQGIAGMSRPEREVSPALASVYRPDPGNAYDAPPQAGPPQAGALPGALDPVARIRRRLPARVV